MIHFNRRRFLQSTGAALTVLSLDQLNFLNRSRHSDRLLAQPTPRKLALLIGINAYPNPNHHLNGPLTDVALQRELLIHRYGFKASDILQLTDAEATRANILNAFETHLIQQAKPDDVVVFHYSGHGSRLPDPNPIKNSPKNGTLVPYDGRIATSAENPLALDIMGRTLFLLAYALPTQNFTMVLDSCHSGGGTRGKALANNGMNQGQTGTSPNLR